MDELIEYQGLKCVWLSCVPWVACYVEKVLHGQCSQMLESKYSSELISDSHYLSYIPTPKHTHMQVHTQTLTQARKHTHIKLYDALPATRTSLFYFHLT